MTSTRTLAQRALSAALVTILILASLPSAWTPAAPSRNLETVITKSVLLGSGAERRVQIEGTVTNRSSQSLFTVQTIFWYDRNPLTTTANLRDSLTDGNRGARVVAFDENFARITAPGGEFLPGATAAFQVSATLEQLGLSEGAAYAVGVQTRASLDGRSIFETLGEDHTALALPAADTKIPITNVVLLTAQPGLIRPGVFVDESLATELNGRLTTLLQAAKDQRADVLVDPALMAEVETMSNGYQVLGDGGLKPGANAKIATDWLAALGNLPGRYQTLFGVPSLGTSPEAATWAARVSPAQNLAYFPNGQATEAALKTVAAAGSQAALVANIEGDEARQIGPLPILRASVFTTAPATKRLELLAAEALILGQKGQLRIIDNLESLKILTPEPWLTPRPLAELLTTPVSVPAKITAPKLTKLDSSYWESAQNLTPNLTAFHGLVPAAADFANQAIAQLISSTWGWNGGRTLAYLDAMTREYGGITTGERLKIAVAPRLVMSAQSTEFPISVINHLSYPVQVKITLNVSNPQRLNLPDPAALTIGPGETGTVNVHPTAESNGIYAATAQLETLTGTKVGDPVELQIEATDLTLLGWVVTLTATAVLVAAVGWRIRKARRR